MDAVAAALALALKLAFAPPAQAPPAPPQWLHPTTKPVPRRAFPVLNHQQKETTK